MGPFRPLLALATLLTAALSLASCEAAGRAKVAARAPTEEERTRYPWLPASVQVRSLEETFAPPEGYARVPLEAGSFGAWLRGLPLRPEGSPVRDFQGRTVLAASDARLAAVGELDVGTADLQQCADSILRLHAEWRWASGHPERIAYRFTSGHVASWPRYAAGDRARVSGSKVTWVPERAAADRSRAAFRGYLNLLFTYAGTLSLQAEGARPPREQLRPGDFFVLGGSPGHTVLVLDVATNAKGERVALVGQGFSPAQDFHVLAGRDGPWFPLEGEHLATPFWAPFPMTSLRRLPSP
ncbi:DUF4846 domain-containing protein [Corallococcus sp. AS-1-6]|uniref:DUF4846 domain-containing protein n=1 Tax=Corallococcus sp. AS-1-6 TaxID=2874599 RepID=UPI001CBC4A70|nr:DUF4846 domain-containing protein [Corallococcus sp. AS-1-6]MBZ4376744.1 DUF4846 domain-containing protein [Corallococcus sp. AS-1-6]